MSLRLFLMRQGKVIPALLMIVGCAASEPLRPIPWDECERTENPWIHALWHEGKEGLGRIYVFWNRPEEAVEALPTLMKAARDKDWGERAVRLLGQMGPSAEPSIALLIEVLADQDRPYRQFAANALALIQRRTDLSLPALHRVLDDPDGGVRTCASYAISWLTHDGIDSK